MHVSLLYTTDWAHPSQKGLEGCDIGQLMAALEVNNRPRWGTDFSLSFITPLTVLESKICNVYSRNTQKIKDQQIRLCDLIFHWFFLSTLYSWKMMLLFITFAVVMPVVYTTLAFSTLENALRFSLKTQGLRFSVNGSKRRLLKAMACLPTFGLRILEDRVINNIMLIVVTVVWTEIISETQWKWQCRWGSFSF